MLRWSCETESAFYYVKQAIQQPLALHRPDIEQPFVLQTDASGVAIALKDATTSMSRNA